MRKVIVNEWMSMNGVVQAPGAADEDTAGGFQHGALLQPMVPGARRRSGRER